MTDFRALCIELTDCLEKADWPLRYRYVFRQWVDIARAALADEPAVPQPQPQPPAEGEVEGLVAWLRERGQERETLHLPGAELSKQLCTAPFLLTRAADLLQRLSPPQPVPVSERLPGPEDCLDEGWAWFFSPRVGWRQAVFPVSTAYTHWLPAHALPIPHQQESING